MLKTGLFNHERVKKIVSTLKCFLVFVGEGYSEGRDALPNVPYYTTASSSKFQLPFLKKSQDTVSIFFKFRGAQCIICNQPVDHKGNVGKLHAIEKNSVQIITVR